MFKQVIKKFCFILSVLVITLTCFIAGYTEKTGLTIGTPAEAHGTIIYCYGYCINVCERCGSCLYWSSDEGVHWHEP